MSAHTDFSAVPISVAPSPATSGISLGVTDANAANLPSIYPWWGVLYPTAGTPSRSNAEIVKVTAGVSSSGTTTYTIVRAQGQPVTTAQTVTTSFSIYDANSSEANLALITGTDNEVPTGSINGSNKSFTTAATFATGKLKVTHNGIRLNNGTDFTEKAGLNGFDFVSGYIAPQTGDTLIVDYVQSTSSFMQGSASRITEEIPTGTINGSNVTFTLAYTPTGAIELDRDGQGMYLTDDYTISGATITMVTAPVTGSKLRVSYWRVLSNLGNADTVDGLHASSYASSTNQLVTNLAGWMILNATLTYSSADSPTFIATTNVDLTGYVGVGDKIWLTQTTSKYFIVTAITSTTITLYGGTDYTLANAAITLPYVSHEKSPFGFPMSPAKWTVETATTIISTQATPSINTIYNIGTVNLIIPIGTWFVEYYTTVMATTTGASATEVYVGISTANNTFSDQDFKSSMACYNGGAGNTGNVQTKRKALALAAKATYYLNAQVVTGATNMSNLYYRGDIGTTFIRAICAYL